LNYDQLIVSVIFLWVDVIMCFSAIVFVISLWRKPCPLALDESEKPFSIDVFVPTYSESCEMLETTLKHCINMDYPHQTFLLDDGNRPEMKSLAKTLGAGYFARENNAGAKAGNLNNALQHTQGELIAVLDADFRPEREFLTRLAAFFNDGKVAVAQSPQHYYNTGSFQHRRISKKEIYSDQDTFMHLVLPARNNWNAAYWIGTNALLRREAIQSIGGFPTDSVTEDVLASMLLHGKGWKTVYVDEPLAYGLAPATVSEYFVQRLRWGKGAFQILRSHNPLFQKGLSFMQRLFYFSSVSHFFEGGVRIVYYLFPAFFFLFGIMPIEPYPPIVAGMLLYFGVTRLLLEVISKKRINFMMDEVYSVIKSFIYLTALPAFLFNKNIRFRVTPKDGGTTISIHGLIGPAVIAGLNLAAIAVVITRLSAMAPMGIFGWIVFIWCLFIGSVAFTACYYCLKPLIKKSK
jgi:cellulose synthase (UDP-forming)